MISEYIFGTSTNKNLHCKKEKIDRDEKNWVRPPQVTPKSNKRNPTFSLENNLCSVSDHTYSLGPHNFVRWSHKAVFRVWEQVPVAFTGHTVTHAV